MRGTCAPESWKRNAKPLSIALVAAAASVFAAAVFAVMPVGAEPNIDVSEVPDGLPNTGVEEADGLYDPVKYVHVDEFDVHIFGTYGITDWTMIGVHSMVYNMLDSLLSQDDKAAFENHHVFVITEDDPDVPFAVLDGHKNTGVSKYTIFTQENICATHAGLLNSREPQWRGWDTPIHEFGHAIELVLDIREETVRVYNENTDWAAETTGTEFFAWGMQSWFDDDMKHDGVDFRNDAPQFRQDYYGSIFDIDNDWKPSCEGGEHVSVQGHGDLEFALDGGVYGSESNGSNVYQYSYSNNENQQWLKIARGGDYFSFQKRGTDYCLDGNKGAENGQSVYLWECSETNENQHWRLIRDSDDGDYYRLEKRDAPGFCIDGGDTVSNYQDVYLWTCTSDGTNQNWRFTPESP